MAALGFTYAFHMPLFIFASGIFAGASWYKRHKAPSDKVLLYLILYLIFLGLVVLLDLVVLHKMPEVNPFNIGSAPWFMLVLALFMLVVPVIGSVRPVSFLVLAVVMAVGSGVFLKDATTLSLSRFFVYLPYFALGFYLQPSNVERVVDVVQNRIGERARILLAAVVLVAVCLVFYFCLNDRELTLIKRVSSGLNLLSALSVSWNYPLWFMIVLRLEDYVLASFLCLLVIMLCPKKRCFLTFMGERSFQVYILHMLIVYCINDFNLYERLDGMGPVLVFSPFVIAPLLTALLAAPKAPNNAVQVISRWTKKITVERNSPMERSM